MGYDARGHNTQQTVVRRRVDLFVAYTPLLLHEQVQYVAVMIAYHRELIGYTILYSRQRYHSTFCYNMLYGCCMSMLHEYDTGVPQNRNYTSCNWETSDSSVSTYPHGH